MLPTTPLIVFQEPTDSYLDISYWASTHVTQIPPLFDFVANNPSLSSLPSAPLTEDNLLALDDTMPSKKNASVGAATESSNPSVNRTFQILELNNILVDDEDAAERGKGVIQEAKNIVKGPRHSNMTDAQAETIRKTALKLSMDDELTFIAGVWKLVIDTKRTVEVENEEEMVKYVEMAWDKDNLKCNWSSPFAANIAPPLRFANPGQEAFAECIPKLKNAYLDLTYSYDKNTFISKQIAINESVKGELCRRNWYSFLIGEAKSVDLPFEIGVAQAARAATTTIYLKRKLKEAAKPAVIAGSSTSKPSSNDNQHSVASSTSTLQHGIISASLISSGGVPGPNRGQRHYRADKSSFIFTFVISPEMARLFVAWAEEEWEGENQEPGINYHMRRIQSYYFGEGAEH